MSPPPSNTLIRHHQFGGESVTYMGVGGTKKWERLESYGPKFVENIVQILLVKRTFVTIRPEQQPFRPERRPSHLFTYGRKGHPPVSVLITRAGCCSSLCFPDGGLPM